MRSAADWPRASIDPYTGNVPADYVLCPLCATPCTVRAAECDVCAQPLGEVPDYTSLRSDLGVWRKRALQGALGFAALAAANVLFLRTGFLFLILPGSVTFIALSRYRALAHRLKHTHRPSTF